MFRQSYEHYADTFRNVNRRNAGALRTNGCLWKESSMSQFIKRFSNDESGATAIEYGLIAASIAVVIITAVQLLGTKLTTVFTGVAGAL